MTSVGSATTLRRVVVDLICSTGSGKNEMFASGDSKSASEHVG
jgi:hypothetical protein